ncbi:hypothetical protein ABW636_14425 [Aquimarina sp. 2201CG1-2-11]|uniref:hypothetical protein n=1 Tax=Aquimarina discodermiae TaxID=3231043 RepID=UPI0034625EB6
MIKGEEEEIIKIPSNIETYHVHGGSGTRLKGGPQDVVQDSKYLEREKHQFKAYFKKIVSYLKSVERWVIFGPADTGERFKKELNLNYKEIATKLDGVYKVDSMTRNQTKALIRDYFKKEYTS